jgi:hypothetical protein
MADNPVVQIQNLGAASTPLTPDSDLMIVSQGGKARKVTVANSFPIAEFPAVDAADITGDENVPFSQEGTVKQSTFALIRKALTDTFNVKDYGWRGNVETDMAAYQACVADAEAFTLSTGIGATIIMPRGTSMVTNESWIPIISGARYIGYGEGATIFQHNDKVSSTRRELFQSRDLITEAQYSVSNAQLNGFTYIGTMNPETGADPNPDDPTQPLFRSGCFRIVASDLEMMNLEILLSAYRGGLVEMTAEGRLLLQNIYMNYTLATGIRVNNPKWVFAQNITGVSTRDQFMAFLTLDATPDVDADGNTVPVPTGVFLKDIFASESFGMAIGAFRQVQIDNYQADRMTSYGLFMSNYNSFDSTHAGQFVAGLRNITMTDLLLDSTVGDDVTGQDGYIILGGYGPKARTEDSDGNPVTEAAPWRSLAGELKTPWESYWTNDNIDNPMNDNPGNTQFLMDNVFIGRYHPAVSSILKWGYGPYRIRMGDPYEGPITETDLTRPGIRVQGYLRDSIFSNCVFGNGGVGIDFRMTGSGVPLYAENRVWERVQIINPLSVWNPSGFFKCTTATSITNQDITIINPVVRCDPFYTATGRNTDGSWTSAATLSAFDTGYCKGIQIVGGEIRDVAKVYSSQAGCEPLFRGEITLSCYPYTVGYDSHNLGIGTLPAAGPSFRYRFFGCDPFDDANYDKFLHEQPVEAADIPDTLQMQGAVVYNSAFDPDANQIMWWRKLATSDQTTDWLSWNAITGAGSVNPQRQYLDFISRLDPAPSPTVQTAYENLFDYLQAQGVLAKLDVLQVYVAETTQAAAQNLVSKSYTATLSNGVFTSLAGYAGNGTNAWIDTGFNPTTALYKKFSRDYGAFGVFIGSNSQSSKQDTGTTGGATSTYIITRNGSNLLEGKINDNSGSPLLAATGITTSIGLSSMSRTGSTRNIYKNGVLQNSDTDASDGLPTTDLAVLRHGTNYSAKTAYAWYVGGGTADEPWDAADEAALNTGLRTYFAAVGLVVP